MSPSLILMTSLTAVTCIDDVSDVFQMRRQQRQRVVETFGRVRGGGSTPSTPGFLASHVYISVCD